MVISRALDEVIDFLTLGPTPEAVIAFKPSAVMQNRADELLVKKRDGILTEEDAREAEQFLLVEHIMRLAKARAKKRLSAA